MSDTPRTDAIFPLISGCPVVVPETIYELREKFEELERDLAAANAEREELRKDAERLAAIESWGGAHIIHWGDDSEWTVGRCCDLDRDPTADDYAGETLRAAIDAAIAAREEP